MIGGRQCYVIGWAGILLTMSACLCVAANAAPTTQPDVPAADARTMRTLEAQVLGRSMTTEQVDGQLELLRDARTRQAAVQRLGQQGAGYQERVAAFAAAQSDIDVREAAVDVVEDLDTAYRTTAAGKQLCVLYARHADRLVAQAWQAFRGDPLDLRAAAMLMSADPDKVLAILERGRDRLDPVRFVLLRIREVPKDDWAAKHLAAYSYTRFGLAAGSVFPVGEVRSETAAMRLVGQTLLRRISGVRQSGASGLPALESVSLIRRQVYVFRTPCGIIGEERLGAFKLDVTGFSASGVRELRPPFTSVFREYGTIAPKGLADLPLLAIEKIHEYHWIQHSMGAPWWVKPHTPQKYHDQISFESRRSGQNEPRVVDPIASVGGSSGTQRADLEPIKPAPAGSPTLVVLPPRLPVVVAAGVQARAHSLCDSLARGVAKTGKVNIIDRSEIDRVLAQRRLTAQEGKPVLAYDAMLRLEVECEGFLPHVSLTLVELSTGNLLASWRLDWPADHDALEAIVADIPARLERLDHGDSRRLHLRLVGVAPTQVRMAPLGLRLERLFAEALSGSKNIVLMQHLEAGTSQEEALLLLTGFSRLGGGRQFAPQADATLELRIAETDAVGRTFEDTPIEVAFRLGRAGAADGAWTSFSGVVREYDALARKAWDALAAQLAKADVGTGRKLLDDLAAMRRQAMTELEAAKSVRDEEQNHEVLTRGKLAHIEAALKIDPLCEEAAYRRVCLLWELYGHEFVKYNGTKDVHELMLAAARYNDLFPQNPERTADVQDRAWLAVRMTRLMQISEGAQVPIDCDLRRLLDAMKHMIEISTSGDPMRLSAGCPRFFPIVCRGMLACEVPLEQREAWIDSVLAGIVKQMTLLEKIPPIHRENFVFHSYWMHVIAASMAVEEGRIDRAYRLVEEMQRRLESGGGWALESSQRDSLVKLLRDVIIKADDAEALARFDKWVGAKQTRVSPIWLANLPKSQYNVYDLSKALIEPAKIVYAPNQRVLGLPMAPLCEGDGYMYFVARDSSNEISWGEMRGMCGQGVGAIVVRIAIDSAGKPQGKSVPSPRRYGSIQVWDSIELLPQPNVHEHLQVLSARFVDGKLYLGTLYSGLLVFDPKNETWTVVDPKAGLPCWGIYSLHDRRDGTLLCTGRDNVNGGYESFCFTYTRKDGKIRVLRKSDYQRHIYVEHNLLELWEHQGRLMGYAERNLVDDVLGETMKWRNVPVVPTPGWSRGQGGSGSYYCARVGDRMFVSATCGLLELDLSGATKDRIFMGGWGVLPGMGEHSWLTVVDVPNPTPASGAIVSDGRYLWFTGSLVLYDPRERLWYGPVMSPIESGYSIATPAGLWLGNRYGVQFIDREQYMAAARQAGRVAATQQYVERRDRAIAEQTAPVPQARILLGLRRFEEARRVLETHLRDHGDDPHAVLLMGMVCDDWGLKDLQHAEVCYSRLEQWGDPKVRLTGMYMRLHLLVRQQRWDEAAKALITCRQAFPLIPEEYQRDLERLDKQIKEHPSAKPETGKAS